MDEDEMSICACCGNAFEMHLSKFRRKKSCHIIYIFRLRAHFFYFWKTSTALSLVQQLAVFFTLVCLTQPSVTSDLWPVLQASIVLCDQHQALALIYSLACFM